MSSLKKIFVSFTLLIFGICTANAEFHYGIKAGMLVNKLSFSQDVFDSNNSCGWTAGAMVEFTIPLIGLNFDSGLMYARMNNASNVVTITNGESTAVTENNLYGKNFLEIPVNIKYKFNIPAIGSIFAPFIFTGPNFAFRLDKSVEDSFSNLKSRTCQIAWNVGLGFQLVKHVQIAASYGFGINNVVSTLSNQADVNLVDSKVKNNYWTVSAAYLF